MPNENLEEKVKLLEKEVRRLQAVNEIQNLVGKYQVYHTPKTFWKTPELFALKQPDVSVEIAMWGVFVGAEQIKAMYQKVMVEPTVGTMFEHHLTTPMIQVAGDGETAKGVWFSPGHETPIKNGKPQPNWCWGKYACDFIREDGEWKIWHMHFYDTFMVPYEKNWSETEQPPLDFDPTVPRENIPPSLAQYLPDKPPTHRSTYYPTTEREPIPGCPEPYETWDGKSVA